MIERAKLANYPRLDKTFEEKNKILNKLNRSRALTRKIVKAYKKGESKYRFSIKGGNSTVAGYVEDYFQTLGYRCHAHYFYSIKEIEVIVYF